MASFLLKQQVIGEVGESSFDDGLWNSYEPFQRMTDLQTALSVYELLLKAKKELQREHEEREEALKREHEEHEEELKREHKEREAELKRKNEDLTAKIRNLKGKGTVVLSVSEAARNKTIRDNYREKEVPAKLVSGGFVLCGFLWTSSRLLVPCAK